MVQWTYRVDARGAASQEGFGDEAGELRLLIIFRQALSTEINPLRKDLSFRPHDLEDLVLELSKQMTVERQDSFNFAYIEFSKLSRKSESPETAHLPSGPLSLVGTCSVKSGYSFLRFGSLMLVKKEPS